MNISIPQPAYQPVVLLRAAGYAPFRDPKTGEGSFVRRLGTEFYPRFHIYVIKDTDDVLDLTLHLDQRRPSYTGSRAHNGEYDGPQIEAERTRILSRIPQ
ncbi:MAG: hypothetical protein WCV86_03955 [Patescibacteria group bacterium]|jgi:hypothetical protein